MKHLLCSLIVLAVGCSGADKAPGNADSAATDASAQQQTPPTAQTAPSLAIPLPAPPPVDSSSAAGQPPAPAQTEERSLHARINGRAWQATQIDVSTVDSSTAITGLGPNGTAILLNLGSVSGTGTVEVTPASDHRYATYISEDAVSFTTLAANGGEGKGTITIAEFNKDRIKGTFSFTATAQTAGKNMATVTAGSFDIKR